MVWWPLLPPSHAIIVILYCRRSHTLTIRNTGRRCALLRVVSTENMPLCNYFSNATMIKKVVASERVSRVNSIEFAVVVVRPAFAYTQLHHHVWLVSLPSTSYTLSVILQYHKLPTNFPISKIPQICQISTKNWMCHSNFILDCLRTGNEIHNQLGCLLRTL